MGSLESFPLNERQVGKAVSENFGANTQADKHSADFYKRITYASNQMKIIKYIRNEQLFKNNIPFLILH